MSAGKSFHSMPGLRFWKDCPELVLGGPSLSGRFASLAVALGGTTCGGAVSDALRRGDTSRWTTHAESGRSLK